MKTSRDRSWSEIYGDFRDIARDSDWFKRLILIGLIISTGRLLWYQNQMNQVTPKLMEAYVDVTSAPGQHPFEVSSCFQLSLGDIREQGLDHTFCKVEYRYRTLKKKMLSALGFPFSFTIGVFPYLFIWWGLWVWPTLDRYLRPIINLVKDKNKA